MPVSWRAVQEVPIASLTVSKQQVRKREVDKNISELVENIRIHGQLEPIVVSPTKEAGQFEIVAGQRRWLALKELGYETISAVVLDETVDEETQRALSISENLIRHDVGSKDLIDACTELYRKYGSINAVAKDLGLPQSKVRNFVKFDRLRPTLKRHVERGDLDIRTALKIEDHCSASNIDDVGLERIVQDVKDMTNAQKADYFRAAKHSGHAPEHKNGHLTAARRVARKPGDVHQILVTLPREDYETLRRWADSSKLTQDQAAARIVSAFFRAQQQNGRNLHSVRSDSA